MTPASRLRAEKARELFAGEVSNRREPIRLATAALFIAAEDQAHEALDVQTSVRQLEALSARAEKRTNAAGENAIAAFNRFMFEEEGFAGNQLDYYDPQNSFLNRVLDRRTGIPITLSILYMEVGRRVGLEVAGIGMPGHFIVRARAPGTTEWTLVDPFFGKVLARRDCQERLDEIFEGAVGLADEHLESITTREILVRSLTNLKAIYSRAGLYRQALAAVERILILTPGALGERRDRGALLAQLGRLPEAVQETQAYLQLVAGADDLEQVQKQLEALQRQQAMRN